MWHNDNRPDRTLGPLIPLKKQTTANRALRSRLRCVIRALWNPSRPVPVRVFALRTYAGCFFFVPWCPLMPASFASVAFQHDFSHSTTRIVPRGLYVKGNTPRLITHSPAGIIPGSKEGAMKITSLVEARREFATQAQCEKHLASMRWPDGVSCPRCGSASVSYMEVCRKWQCK